MVDDELGELLELFKKEYGLCFTREEKQDLVEKTIKSAYSLGVECGKQHRKFKKGSVRDYLTRL